MQRVGGSEALDEPYMDISLSRMVRKRAGWLVVLFLGEMLTATAMGFFEREIERAVVLALFVPLIISSGGNSGSQASTLVIRAMAVGELRLKDWWRVIRREAVSGVMLGGSLGSIGFLRISIWSLLSTRRSGADGHRAVGDAGGLDAAAHSAAPGLRPGHFVGAFRRHPGRRHGSGYLFLRRTRGPQGYAVVRETVRLTSLRPGFGGPP
jgi:Mg/Co/Ni transporter MgtE